MPLDYQSDIRGTLKVYRALMPHISFLLDGIPFDSIDSRVVFHITITYVKNLFSDFYSICSFPLTKKKAAKILWDFDFAVQSLF